ncbi:MAG: NIPSNAP family protein [Verrucomicrobia bacterium]|nr:NIPSNAP family protein [Verrucomicrobiota bacterium]MBT5311328.1 NIPSNAP family protein [Verrucomicrobiota bacterium]MBT6104624.1 NIPSNAP family protein [Verrucomicrobiota bacterium]MBT7910247.1 NIPSNAP family protein [Verrucomicrobiota bacterium]
MLRCAGIIRIMFKKTHCLVLLAAAFLWSPVVGLDFAQAEEKNRVFEIRTYYANEGKLDALLARFRDHTVALFKKHGMTNVGYWVPADNKENKLVYMLAFPSREARNKAFKAFGADPDWQKAYKESTKDGRLVKKIVNDFLTGTDFSKIK